MDWTGGLTRQARGRGGGGRVPRALALGERRPRVGSCFWGAMECRFWPLFLPLESLGRQTPG